MKKFSALLILWIAAIGQPARAQSQDPATKALYDTLFRMDSALFAVVYTCDTARTASFFTAGLEFYHDKGGVTHGRDALIETLYENFCRQTTQKLRRELVPGSLQVYPMDNFGAIQTGEHRFYSTEKGKPERLTGIARFTHLWQFSNNEWRICRILSYDHRPLE